MRVKVLLDNGPTQPEPLRITEARLRTALADRPDVLAAIDVTISDSEDDWIAAARDAEIIFAGRHVPLPPSGAPRLRWLQSISAGVEDYCRFLPADVTLTNASGVHAGKAGEFMLAAALMLNFCIPQFASDKQARRWTPRFGGPLAGKTVTVLGVGAIGRAGAALLRAAKVHVIGVTRSGRPDRDVDEIVAVSGIDRVLPRTDILISTAPATPTTRGLIDASRLDLLPWGAGVVVVGRAAVLDYVALERGLRSGRFGGAVLDVFEAEPLPPEHSLWDCPNLIMTPHCSLDDHGSYLDGCLRLFAENLERYLAGASLRNVVDKQAGY